MTTEHPTTFGALLKYHRLAAGLTQETLAEQAALSARAISDLERGINRVPQHETVVRLAAALDLSAGERAEFQMLTRHLDGRSVAAAASAIHPAPLPLTPLIGREREEAALRSWWLRATCASSRSRDQAAWGRPAWRFRWRQGAEPLRRGRRAEALGSGRLQVQRLVLLPVPLPPVIEQQRA